MRVLMFILLNFIGGCVQSPMYLYSPSHVMVTAPPIKDVVSVTTPAVSVMSTPLPTANIPTNTATVMCPIFKEPKFLPLPKAPLAQLSAIAANTRADPRALDDLMLNHISEIKRISRYNQSQYQRAYSEYQRQCAVYQIKYIKDKKPK